MARVKLDIPENYVATITIPVRISDINYGNHVGNDAFVTIIQEARTQWLYSHDYTELDIEGTGLIQADLALEYKSEAYYGDTIEIYLSIVEISRVSFEIYYKLITKRKSITNVLALAKTGMVCYDYTNKKVMPVPEKLKQFLQKK